MAHPLPLDAYPRPGVTVDLAILTVTSADTDPVLRVLVQDRTDPSGAALPGAFVRERRTVAETVADVLERKVGISPGVRTQPQLLRLFDDPDRDDRTWAMSVAHSVSLPESELAGAKGDLVPVSPDGRLEGVGSLLFDHDLIVSEAVAALRERYEFRFRLATTQPDEDRFLGEPFTLHQLRKVHEAVIGEELHKDNFARRMKPFVDPVTEGGKVVSSSGLRGRPATLYRRKGL